MKKNTLFIYSILLLSFLTAFGQNDADIDLSFSTGNGFDGTVNTICIQSDGKILVGGLFNNYNGTQANGIIRLNLDGTVDTNFNYGTGFNGSVSLIKVQSNGKIIVFGNYSTYKSLNCNNLIRLESNGNFDNTFTLANVSNTIYTIKVDSSNNIFLGGQFSEGQQVGFKNKLMKLDQNGNIVSSFNNQTFFTNGIVTVIEIQQDNKLLIGGTFGTSNPLFPNFIRLNSDSTLDNSFNSLNGFTSTASNIQIEQDGKIIAVGNFDNYYQNSSFGVPNGRCRINNDGTKDGLTFSQGIIGFDLTAKSIQIQNDGKILIAGLFTNYNNASYNRIIRLNTNGLADNTFQIGSGLNSFANVVQLQNDGKILIGGLFTNYNGALANRIVRLKGNTVLSNSKFIEKSLSLFPNPVKEVIYISNIMITEYEIFDTIGKSVLKGKTNENQINVNSLTKGVYILKLKNEENTTNHKFLKE